ncbi:hypothetical protein [Lysobacter sp. M2-1]|uniref:hypothetical protein n=1 Tax=Lysobacter sp. M2-1 TaxID=2916839 RepID=UPI001F5A8F27|nr:hypothetical protein [Lysobacter sp. M2-1]
MMEIKNFFGAGDLPAPEADAVTVNGRDCAVERIARPKPVAMDHELEARRARPVQRLGSGLTWPTRASEARGTSASHRRLLQSVGSRADGRCAVPNASAKLRVAMHNHDTGRPQMCTHIVMVVNEVSL